MFENITPNVKLFDDSLVPTRFEQARPGTYKNLLEALELIKWQRYGTSNRSEKSYTYYTKEKNRGLFVHKAFDLGKYGIMIYSQPVFANFRSDYGMRFITVTYYTVDDRIGECEFVI